MRNLPLCFLDPGQLAMFIPVLGIVAGIVAILTRHQQRMAEIIHASGNQPGNVEIHELRREVYELKQLVHQQTIALDSYTDRSRRLMAVPGQRQPEEL